MLADVTTPAVIAPALETAVDTLETIEDIGTLADAACLSNTQRTQDDPTEKSRHTHAAMNVVDNNLSAMKRVGFVFSRREATLHARGVDVTFHVNFEHNMSPVAKLTNM